LALATTTRAPPLLVVDGGDGVDRVGVVDDAFLLDDVANEGRIRGVMDPLTAPVDDDDAADVALRDDVDDDVRFVNVRILALLRLPGRAE
jgi:hypothetical protein